MGQQNRCKEECGSDGVSEGLLLIEALIICDEECDPEATALK